jgi:hypothetical protein
MGNKKACRQKPIFKSLSRGLPEASRFAGAASLTQGPDGRRRFIDFGFVTQGESFLGVVGAPFSQMRSLDVAQGKTTGLIRDDERPI